MARLDDYALLSAHIDRRRLKFKFVFKPVDSYAIKQLYRHVIKESYASDGARCLKVRELHENRTYQRNFTSDVRASLAGSPGPHFPQKKIEFGIGGDAIYRCLEGLTCTLLNRSSVTFSLPPPLTPTISTQI